MTEQLQTLIKEIGFKSKLFESLTDKSVIIYGHFYYLWLCEIKEFLREKFDIHIWAIPITNNDGRTYMHETETFKIPATKTEQLMSFGHKMYKDALEYGIIEAIKMIIESGWKP